MILWVMDNYAVIRIVLVEKTEHNFLRTPAICGIFAVLFFLHPMGEKFLSSFIAQ